jgi:hypothetical protein
VRKKGFRDVARTPHIKSFLIADQVFQQTSRKWCVIGIFDRIWVRRFPSLHPSVGLYLQVSDAEGDYDVKVSFQTIDGTPLAQLTGVSFSVKDPLVAPGFGVQAHNLPLPAPGTYLFKVFFNDQESAADIRLEVVEHPPMEQT